MAGRIHSSERDAWPSRRRNGSPVAGGGRWQAVYEGLFFFYGKIDYYRLRQEMIGVLMAR